MALDYVSLRNTLDAGNNSIFAQNYSQAIGNDAYNSLQNQLRIYLTNAKSSSFTQSNLNNQLQKFNQSVDSYFSSLTDINKYITTDTGYQSLADSYKKLAVDLQTKGTNVFSSSDFRNIATTGLKKINPNYNYSAASIQSTGRLDTNQLSDFFKNPLTAASQDQYRSELATRLNNLFSGANLSDISAGQVLGGDARFEENNTKQMLMNLSSDLKNLQLTTSSDRTASSLAGLIDESVSAGMISNNLASLFGSRTGDPASNVSNSISIFDTYNKSLTTQANEAAAKAEAEKQAQEAEAARIAQAQAVAEKQKMLLKRGMNPLSSALQFAQSLRGDTALGSSETSADPSKLGNIDTYGK